LRAEVLKAEALRAEALRAEALKAEVWAVEVSAAGVWASEASIVAVWAVGAFAEIAENLFLALIELVLKEKTSFQNDALQYFYYFEGDSPTRVCFPCNRAIVDRAIVDSPGDRRIGDFTD